jgi:hypothetical protein
MLEHQTLLLLPWSDTQHADLGGKRGCLAREIIDPTSGLSLGFACRRRPPGPSWLRWLGRLALEIHESDDESLLFTLYQHWFFRGAWEVRDAEEQAIGRMKRNRVLDRFGRQLASIAPAAGGHTFLSSDGVELGGLAAAADGHRLSFAAEIGTNPFARMLLLGCSLALTNSAK